jgi:hypothetical protein
MEYPETKDYFLGFEGNRLRPLKKVLNTKWIWDENNNALTMEDFNPETQLDWPEKADNVHLAVGLANWDYRNNKYQTNYSQEIVLKKEEKTQTIRITIENQEPKIENSIQLVYLFIGFSTQERKKTKELKRSNNTVSIIVSK